MYRPSSLPQPCDAAAWTLPPPPSTTLLPACNRRRSTAELPATAALRHTTFWQGAQGGSSPWGSSQQTYRRRAWSQAGQPAVQCSKNEAGQRPVLWQHQPVKTVPTHANTLAAPLKHHRSQAHSTLQPAHLQRSRAAGAQHLGETRRILGRGEGRSGAAAAHKLGVAGGCALPDHAVHAAPGAHGGVHQEAPQHPAP
jgi:hypothetical protein